MVACAAAASTAAAAAIQLLVYQPVGVGCGMQQNPQNQCAVVDQLKQQLQQLVTENGDDLSGAIHILSSLEKLALTKEVLETTRIGATVNELRKQSAQRWPEVSKRCRTLIKSWQKIAEFHRPISSCEGSSNGGTPNLVSPALKRGLTPRTPGKSRITSTDSNSRSVLSRSNAQDGLAQNGSYAPQPKGKSISPYFPNSAQVHKSASVGGALSSLKCSPSADIVSVNSDEFSRDSLPSGADAASLAAEKRKNLEEPPLSISAALKRSKGNALKFGTQFPPVTGSSASNLSVVAARKDVQSTAELVAQLSENLPQNLAIDLVKHEGELQRDRPIPSTLDYIGNGSSKTSPANEFTANQAKPKRKYTKRAAKFFRNSSDAQLCSGMVDDEGDELGMPTSNGYLGKIPEELGPSISKVPDIKKQEDGTSSMSLQMDEQRATTSSFDWYSGVPDLNSLKERAAEYAKPYDDCTSSFVIPIRQRQVLLLPYVDIGLPDFVEHQYPEPEQYLARQNFPAAADFSQLQINKNNTSK